MELRIASALALALAASAPAMAQGSETAPAPRPSPPVFDLRPGNPVDPEPEPNVQGPRIPGESVPRLIDRDRQTPSADAPGPSAPAQSGPARPAPAATSAGAGGVPPVAGADRSAPTGTATATNRPPPGSAPDARANVESAPASPSGNTPTVTTGPAPGAMPPAMADGLPSIPGTAAAPPSIDEPGQGFPLWWLLVPLGLAVLLAAGLGLRRRRAAGGAPSVDDARLFEAPAKNPAAPAPPAPQPKLAMPTHRLTPDPESEGSAPAPMPAAEPAPTADAPARFEVQFMPLSARFTPQGLTIAYRLEVANVGSEPLGDVAVALSARPAERLATSAASAPTEPVLAIERLETGTRAQQDGEIRLPSEAIEQLEMGGRNVCVPVVEMVPRYRDAEAKMHQRRLVLLVGCEHDPPTAKMAPFPLDKPFTHFGRLGCRMVQVPENAAVAA